MKIPTLLSTMSVLLIASASTAAAAVDADYDFDFDESSANSVSWKFEDQRQQQSLIRGQRQYAPPSLLATTRSNADSSALASTSCYSHTDCHNCTKASTTCHWCSHDQRCHVLGSLFYGCALGSSCPSDQDKKKKKKKPDDSCFAFPNCTSCGDTHTCHWCAHDDSCHLIGSPYGCVRGVDCFAEDRCRRNSSQPLPHNDGIIGGFTNMGGEDLTAVFLVGGVLILCLSCCLYCACGVKGSYDDLYSVLVASYSHHPSHNTIASSSHPMHHDIHVPASGDDHDNSDDNGNDPAVESIPETAAFLPEQPQQQQHQQSKAADPENDTIAVEVAAPQSVSSPAALEQTPQPAKAKSKKKAATAATTSTSNNSTPAEESGHGRQSTAGSEFFYQAMEEEGIAQDPESTPLLSSTPTAAAAAAVQTTVSIMATEDMYGSPPPLSSSSSSKHMRRIMGVCTCLYLVAVLTVAGILLTVVRFFPAFPEYSVCNNAVAWRKLIDSLATFKTADIDIEILISIENANHLDVALDEGHGTFRHGGEQVGHYIVPPVSVAAMAITDVLIIATLTPSRSQALALTRDYYEDTLVLNADIDLILRTPFLFNYSKEVTIHDKAIQVNQKQDRHLCACVKWNNNATSALL